MSEWEPYRIVLDYEALQEGFLDRIEDLNTTHAQIDMAAGLGGNISKLLNRGPAVPGPDRHHRDRRILGWESLGKMLKGTGLALVLVIDDERFAPIKERLAQRRNRRQPPMGSIKRPAWLFTREKSHEMQILRNEKLSPQQRKRIAKKAAKARWRARRIKARSVGTLSALQAQSCSAHGQPAPLT